MEILEASCNTGVVLQAKRDNSSVYFQHVPTPDSMPAIQPIRLAKSTPYVLPAPAMLVTEALQDAFAEVPAEKVTYCSPPHCFSPMGKILSCKFR